MKKILMIIIALTFVSCVENTSNRRRVANRPPSNGERYQDIHTIRLLNDGGNGLETYKYTFNSDSTWIELTCFDNHNHKIPVNAIRDIKTE